MFEIIVRLRELDTEILFVYGKWTDIDSVTVMEVLRDVIVLDRVEIFIKNV